MIMTAISQSWLVFSSMASANRAPVIAAGSADTATSHPRRPSEERGLVNAALVRRTMS